MQAIVIIWILSGIAAGIASCLSFYLIFQHVKNYNYPDAQRCIVRIILMVPIYSINSWLSLRFAEARVYLNLFRDCYEAYVLYNFFVLLIWLLDGEVNMNFILKTKKPFNHPWPFCCLPKVEPGRSFYYWSKVMVLQYSFIKSTFAIIAVILEAVGYYGDGEWSTFSKGFVYLGTLNGISVTLSMYYLVLFYMALSEELKVHRIVAKFLCIKAVIFLAFWQGFVIGFFEWLGLIPELGGFSEEQVKEGSSEFLICIEMVMISAGHLYAFSHKDYMIKDQNTDSAQKLHRLDDSTHYQTELESEDTPLLLESKIQRNSEDNSPDHSYSSISTSKVTSHHPHTTGSSLSSISTPSLSSMHSRSTLPRQKTNPVKNFLDALQQEDMFNDTLELIKRPTPASTVSAEVVFFFSSSDKDESEVLWKGWLKLKGKVVKTYRLRYFLVIRTLAGLVYFKKSKASLADFSAKEVLGFIKLDAHDVTVEWEEREERHILRDNLRKLKHHSLHIIEDHHFLPSSSSTLATPSSSTTTPTRKMSLANIRHSFDLTRVFKKDELSQPSTGTSNQTIAPNCTEPTSLSPPRSPVAGPANSSQLSPISSPSTTPRPDESISVIISAPQSASADQWSDQPLSNLSSVSQLHQMGFVSSSSNYPSVPFFSPSFTTSPTVQHPRHPLHDHSHSFHSPPTSDESESDSEEEGEERFDEREAEKGEHATSLHRTYFVIKIDIPKSELGYLGLRKRKPSWTSSRLYSL
eukprot:TRINITY_DN5052_c0_g1_i1.p1 TRINITY_DN5052_c0_g1~~TRINITY_DN5052_c0_g1_i1.p1  ORF type:complete len:748 (-),score=121.48 TRINITY_DN5052_c0_g1_i1:114-2357(-)